ncbi:MAG: T9SS type A sorting domain-containing protein [Bacteroidia bacterium]
MKKIIFTTLLSCLLITKSFAGPFFSMHYYNYTQNTFGGGVGIQSITVQANIGDSIKFDVLDACAGSIYLGAKQWYYNGDSIPNTAGAFFITQIITQSGNYSAPIEFCWLNIGLNFYVVVNNTTGIESVKNINFLNVFPTSVTSSITIQLNSIKPNDVEISFFDINGKQLKTDFYKNVFGEFIKNENTEALAKGIYFLRIKAGEEMVNKKFVKM